MRYMLYGGGGTIFDNTDYAIATMVGSDPTCTQNGVHVHAHDGDYNVLPVWRNSGFPANYDPGPSGLCCYYTRTWVQYTQFLWEAPGGGTPASISSPPPGSVLSGPCQLFTWNAAAGATQYAIYAGSTPGGYNYFASLVAGTSITVPGLPTNGSTVYIRLWTDFNGTWQFFDYAYTAASGGTPASISSPPPGSVLSGSSQLFTWNAAAGATGYAIYAGSTQGAYNYFASLFTGTSGTATGLPTNGSTVWIRLWTNFSGTWQTNDYTYTAANGGGAAAMTSPAPGSDIGGTVNFTWNAVAGATGYALYVGTQGVATYDVYGALVGGTSQSVPNVPGGTIYVRLWTNFAGGWQFVDYVYQ
jgi:hypothetical protein